MQKLNRAILPPGEAAPDWEILTAFLGEINPEATKPQKIQDVFQMLANEVGAFNDLTLQKIGDQGVQITETGETIPLLEKERKRIENKEIVG